MASSNRAEEEYAVEEGLYYTKDHEWIRKQSSRSSSAETIITVGITDYAAKMLHDIVFVQLPEIGREFKEKDVLCQVESIKTVADVYSPVSGKVLKVNDSLTVQPEKVSQSPYKDGWMVELASGTVDQDLRSLMTVSEYKDYITTLKAEG